MPQCKTCGENFPSELDLKRHKSKGSDVNREVDRKHEDEI